MKTTFLKKLCFAFACATFFQPVFAHEACETSTAQVPPPASQNVPSPDTPPATGNAITVAELVRRTAMQNPELRFYENEIRFARDRSAVAERWSDPELTVEIGRKSARESDGSYGGDGLAWGVTLAQKFDFTGRNALRKAIAERQVERAQAGLDQFRRELAAKTAELGYSLLAAQQRMEAAEEIAARGRALLKTLVQRDPAGVAALLETRVIEADIFKLEKTAAAQRAALLSALAELNMLRGLAPETPLALANEPVALLPVPNNAALLGKAFRDNFTLRQFELDFREQGLVVDLERKNGYGDVTIAPYYSEERAGSTERTMGVGVTVPLPFFDANKAGVAEARSREGQAENALRKARRDLHKDIAAAALDYRMNQELLADWGTEKIRKMREAAELGERHYRMGTVPVSTYLALQQAYLETVETVTTTRSDAIKSAAQLTALTGIPTEQFFSKEKPPAPESHNHTPDDKHDDHDGHDYAKKDDHSGHAHEKSAPEAAKFSESEGLNLTPESIAALALKTAPAAQQSIAETIPVTAQIISTNPPRAVASVSQAIAEKLKTATCPDASIRISDTTAKYENTVDVTLELKPSVAVSAQFAACVFRSAPTAPVLALPREAILKTAEGNYVYRVAGDRFKRVPVKLGVGDEKHVAILSGIAAGDVIAVTAVEQLWLTELRLTKGGGHSH